MIDSVAASCMPASVQAGQSSQCTANVTGTGAFSSNVQWAVEPSGIGSISSDGTFIGAAVGTATITGTSAQDPSKSGTTSVTVTPVTGIIALTVLDLPPGANASVSVSGPGGYSAQETGSQNLQNLALGTYTLKASSVHFGNYSYLPTTSSVTVNVANSTPVSASVD
jgi:Bacterial Ig-like domain (group 2)